MSLETTTPLKLRVPTVSEKKINQKSLLSRPVQACALGRASALLHTTARAAFGARGRQAGPLP